MPSVLDLIGATPLIEVTRIERGPCRLFLKLESANPSGSIKDRPARTMIEAAEAEGKLQTRRHHCGSNRRQYRARPCPCGRAQGVSHFAGGAGQDGAREGIARARHGRRSRDHAFRCREGPPRLLSGSRAGDCAAHPQCILHQSVRQSGKSARARDAPPAPKFFGRCRAGSMRSSPASARAARSPEWGASCARHRPQPK